MHLLGYACICLMSFLFVFKGDGHSPIGRVAIPIVSHFKKPTEIPHDDGMTIPQIPCFEHVMPCSKVLEVVPGSEALGPSPKHTRAELSVSSTW